jgi:hypothetical protein
MLTGRLALCFTLAATTVACGRVSQWIHVTDCAKPGVPVPNARVMVQEIFIEQGARERPHDLGHVANGGNTNAQGITWDSFSRNRRSVAVAVLHHPDGKISDAEAERQPMVRIPPNPSQPIAMCVHYGTPQ